ncbi:hypothetical protein [Flavobacterium sp. N1736]|uniref:hypothetical protein n=1 Tax=Flavobacterium sp. N1736 TaxID=2986823 RepID=UPI002224352D|nr:hypothetical protein [Flavobacterium sp. N1736]
MKKIFMFAMASLFMSSCQNEDASSADSSFSMKASKADYLVSLPTESFCGDITTNTTWTNDKVWEICGVVRVKNGATLTIQPGTYIIAAPILTLGDAQGILVITKTGKIDAQGTLTAPIIFTSRYLLDGNVNTTGSPGDFGGVVILGDAQVNNGLTTNIAEGLGDQLNVADFYYGGTNNVHNAGILNYVRIEFAGRILDVNNEVNSLSLAGVGSGTVIDHVQASYGLDDSFEFFGGTVNAGHLVSFAPKDDNFDFDLGYTGTITKAIAVADGGSQHSDSNGFPDSDGIEVDNGLMATSIITRPVLSQLSIIGVSSSTAADVYESGIHVRRFGQIRLIDATVTGYNTGIKWDVPSVPTSSSWSRISIHGFDNVVLPAGTTLSGLGNSTSTVDPATAWGLTQPFFNNGALNFTGATGAFRTEALWTNVWTKFTNF